MPGRMFSDRLASARQRALGAQADKEDEKASARRAAIVQGLPDPDDPNPPPPPAPSWFQQHNPFDVGALKSDLSSLGSRITHPVDTWKAANRGVISGVRSIDSYTDAGDKAIHNYLDDSPVGQFARGGKNLVRDTAKGLFDTVQGLSEVPAAVAPVLWRGLKPGANPDDRKGAHDILKILDGQGVEDVRKVLTDKPWRNIDPGYEHASKAKTPWERAGGYTAATAMALLPTKYGKAALGKTLSGVANVGGELIESASAAGRSGIGATLDAVGDLKNRMTPPPKVPLTGQTSPRFPRALPAFGETTPGGEPFVSHPDIGVGHPNNPVLGVVEQQGGRSRFSIRGQRPAAVPPPPIIESPYTANLLPAAGEGSASRKFPERVFTSHPDLGIALPEEPPLGVVEKFTPRPVSAGMGRTPAAQMSPATRAFEALVPDRYKGALTPEGLAVNKLGEVSGPPRKGLRTLTETGLKNPTTTTSLAEMVDMYGLEEAAQRAQMTTKEVTDYLASRPAGPQAAVPIAPSATKLGPVTAGEVPPVVEAPPVKKGRASRARPVAAPPKAAAPPASTPLKSRPFEKSPTSTLESLAKRGNPHAIEELVFRKENPHLQKTTNTTGEQGAIGTNINKPWGEIDTSEYSLNARREAVKDAINRAYEQDTYGMSPKARERVNREIRSLEMIQNVLADDTLTNSGGSSWPGASNKKFFYGEDPKAPGGISSAISGRITTHEGQPSLKIPYLGSIIPGEGRKLIKGLQKWGLGKGAKGVIGSPLTDARPVYESMGARPHMPGSSGYEGTFGNIAGATDAEIYRPYPSEMPEGVAKRMEKYQKKPTPKTEAELANEAALQDAQRGAEDARNAGNGPGSSRSWDRSGRLADEDFSDWVESLDHDTRRHYDHANVPEDVMEAVTRQPDVVGDRPYREAQIRRFETLEQEGSISRADQDALDDWRAIQRHETGSMSVSPEPTARASARAPLDPELETLMRDGGVDVAAVRNSPYLRDSWESSWTRDRAALEADMRERVERIRAQNAPPEPTPAPELTDAENTRASAKEPRLGPVEGSPEWWADNERGAVRLPSWNQVKAGGRKVKKGVGIGLDAANQVRIGSMLSGWALPKSVIGNVGAHGVATLENIAAGKGRASFRPIKEGLNLKANLKEFKSGWKQGANPLIASSSNLGKFNPITRTMGAADHAATKSLMRAGLTEQQAQRLLLTDPQYGMKGASSKVLDYLVPFRKIPFNVLQAGGKTMGDHPFLSTAAGAAGAGMGSMSDDPRVLALSAALMGPYTLPYLIGAGATAGTRAIQGLSPIPEWSLQKSLGDPLHPFAEPSFFKMFDEGGQKKKSYREKIGDRSVKPRGRKVPKR